MIVMKFGGSSVANAERIEAVRKIVSDHLNEKPVMISSALGKTTDLLIAAGERALSGIVDLDEVTEHHQQVCKELSVSFDCIAELNDDLEALIRGIAQIREISLRTNDFLVSFGERMAVRIIAEYFCSNGLKARGYDSWDLGLLTDANYGAAKILPDTYQKISESVSKLDHLPIVTGYIAKSPVDSITTFGRGGSDLTATIFGAALKAKEIQVWKDVSGLMTADPRVVTTAQAVENISFSEAEELAYFGAKVLHPLSMRPAKRAGIPVRVKNSYRPEDPGTVISDTTDFSQGLIKSITVKHNIFLIDIVSLRSLGAHGFLAKVFQVFAQHNVIVDMLASSEVSVSLTVEDEYDYDQIIQDLEEIAQVNVQNKHCIISLVYCAENSSAVLEAISAKFKAEGLNPKMISQGASKINLSLVFNEADANKALLAAHQALLDFRTE